MSARGYLRTHTLRYPIFCRLEHMKGGSPLDEARGLQRAAPTFGAGGGGDMPRGSGGPTLRAADIISILSPLALSPLACPR